MGRKALAVQCDIASFADAEKVVNATKEEFGSLEILINNAGMNWDGVSWKMRVINGYCGIRFQKISLNDPCLVQITADQLLGRLNLKAGSVGSLNCEPV